MQRGRSITAPFSQFLLQIFEISEAAKHVVVCHSCFSQLSSSLAKIRLLLGDVFDGESSSCVFVIIQALETQLKYAKELVSICTHKSKFYLLLNCRTYANSVREILSSLASTLLELLPENVDISLKSKNKIKLLCIDIQAMQIRISAEEEELLKKVEHEARTQYIDAKHSNELLYKMATLAGISLDSSALKHEYDELRREKEMVAQNKHENDVLQLERIIFFLGTADGLGSATGREQRYLEQRQSLDNNMVPPLQTFLCPITQDVMENPVEIDSGQTFEMAAIQKWFAEGHRVCPVTKMELQNLSLRPNRLLHQSIEEWKDRNTIRRLASMAGRINSGNDEQIMDALQEIHFLCEEKSIHKYWVAAEGLIPVLVGLLGSNKRELKKKSLATLSTLVAGNSENRVKVGGAGAIEFAVRSLARDAGEARQAVTLLMELSKEESLCEMISKVQGCILLLVTLVNSEHTVAAMNAKYVLTSLAKDDNNIVLMAEVNYFKPLLECLEKGSQSTQILMANTLSRIQLSDQSSGLLVQGGAAAALVRLTSESNAEGKTAALGALQNLSAVQENRNQMIEGGVIQPLLEILFTVKTVAVKIREHAAATFANLALSSQSCGNNDLWGNHGNIDEILLQLMSLLTRTGPGIQSHILRALNSICYHSDCVGLRETLREHESIQFLARFMDDKNTEVRLYALKLLLTITNDGGGDILAQAMVPDSYQVMVSLFSLESFEEEKAAAMGILGNLPLNDRQITERMLQAGLLSSIVTILKRCFSRIPGRTNTPLVENAVWALVRFTLPTNIDLQLHTAKHGVIPLLVNLLSVSSPLVKCRAAMSLQQFSENTPKLSVPIKRSKSWSCFASPLPPVCNAHGGVCSVEETFCLLEAGAISPLIQVLEEKEANLDEAALSALVTLVSDECWERGTDVLVNANGVLPIIRKLSVNNIGVQEMALLLLEKILRKEKYKAKFGSVAQMSLVSLAQEGTVLTRPLAAKLLAHLNILHDQSSYFGDASNIL